MTQAAADATKTKLSEFLASKKIDPRRILAASAELENHRTEDKAILLARRRKKAGGDAAAKIPEELIKKKPRSGRPVTPRSIQAALSGKKISGPQKTRILKAINKVLETKKQEPVGLDLLF
jgi:hypothetical protein